jgi:membrane-bound lytic murein transglycosylase F
MPRARRRSSCFSFLTRKLDRRRRETRWRRRDSKPILPSALAVALVLGSLMMQGVGQATLHPQTAVEEPRDLAEIVQRDTLVVVTGIDAKNSPLAYESEMAQAVGERLGVKVRILAEATEDEMLRALRDGRADVVAYDLMYRADEWYDVVASYPHTLTDLVLVQSLPQSWELMSEAQLRGNVVRRPSELAGKTVVIPDGCACIEDLRFLSAGAAPGLKIDVAEGMDQAALIQLVARGEIDYTVAYEGPALASASSESTIDTRTALFAPSDVGMVVRRSSVALRDTINAVLVELQQAGTLATLFETHYRSPRDLGTEVAQYAGLRSRLAPYDHLVRPAAERVGWDWTLYAAQMYQESRFDTRATSFAGARGLMQVMPATGRWMGYGGNLYEPQTNILAATKFIEYLQTFWNRELPDVTDHERLPFILASYNVGPGHVQDARRLTIAAGQNPNRWSQVREWLLRKSDPSVHRSSVVRHGYARGWEPVQYVDHILRRQASYRQIIAQATVAERTVPLVRAPGIVDPLDENRRRAPRTPAQPSASPRRIIAG